MKYVIGIVIIFLFGCTSEKKEKVYISPITGEKVVFTLVGQDNWELYSANDGKVIFLAREGMPFLWVTDAEWGRHITIESKNNILGTADLIDENYDGSYDIVKYRNKTIEVTDAELDGIVDMVINYDKKTTHVLYNGKLTELYEENNLKYVIENKHKIDMEKVNGIFVPKGE